MPSVPPSHAAVRARLLALDAFTLFASYFAVHSLRLDTIGPLNVAFFVELAVFALINVFCLYLFDLYAVDGAAPAWSKPLQTLLAALLAGCGIVLVFYVAGTVKFSDLVGRGVLMGSQLLFALFASCSRIVIARWGHSAADGSRWLVLGTSESMSRFFADLACSSTAGAFTVLGSAERLTAPANKAVSFIAGDTCEALREVASKRWSGVIVAGSAPLSEDALEILIDMRRKGAKVIGLADFYEQTWHKVPASSIERRWLAMSHGFSLLRNPLRLRLKRVFDIVGALSLLLLTLPVLVLTAIAIKLESRGPVLFKQVRVGEEGSLFTIFKLRSMRTDAEKNGPQWASQNDARVTRVGAFTRRTRIDELPQLLNVLDGSMSFVGPRPERPEFTSTLEHQIPFYALRHALKPGVTGWAQVMYPYGASVEDALQKLQYDLYYIKNHSLTLDLAIVIKTIRVVFLGVKTPRSEPPVLVAPSTPERVTAASLPGEVITVRTRMMTR
jgi:sugar transferase (PEP-CTERM system associated)